jgi:hypothetical protein
VLGGVTVSTDVGFGTHTDGDVLCHALIDALAGAIADGDLGTHYPEDDPETNEARSLDFVEEFAGYVRRAGYRVVGCSRRGRVPRRSSRHAAQARSPASDSYAPGRTWVQAVLPPR